MSGKRVDPEDGEAYTYEEIAAHYKGKFKRVAIDEYWETLKKAKGKKGKEAPAPKAKVKAKAKAKVKAKDLKPRVHDITIGYHGIRGLGAPLRMMCFYANAPFTNVAYGNDMKEKWFGEAKPKLLEKNAAINLPYIIHKGKPDGPETIVTQSNTCLLFLGRTLRIDKGRDFFHNHLILDQVMDWRNDLMKIVYPFAGVVKDKSGFNKGATEHLEGTTKTNATKLEGLCKGPYMCGNSPQSGDFHVFEMLDQHMHIAKKIGAADVFDACPKLKALHAAFEADPKLKKYFDSVYHKDYPQNNGLVTHYTGQGDDFVYGPTSEEKVTH